MLTPFLFRASICGGRGRVLVVPTERPRLHTPNDYPVDLIRLFSRCCLPSI